MTSIRSERVSLLSPPSPTDASPPPGDAEGATDSTARAAAGGAADSAELGRRIRELRIEQRLTLKQVENGAGLSATHLSEIERGRTSPTVGALLRIARALGKHPAFFVEPRELPEVAGFTGAETAVALGPGLSAQPLSSGIAGGRLHPYRVKLAASSRGWTLPESEHEGLFYVASGSIETSLRAGSQALAAGDAVHARLARGLEIRASGRAAAELIVALTHPLESLPSASEARAGEPDGDGDASHELPPVELGRRIKMFRVSKGLTLKDLEERGGVSATHVSEIERGRASPTLGALGRIALGLGVRASDLVEPSTLQDFAVGLAAERDHIATRWGEAMLRPLAPPIRGARLEASILTLPIGRGAAFTHHHGGEEWILAVTGQAAIEFGPERHALRPGEAVHFRAEIPHAYVNAWSSPAVLLSVCRTPIVF